MQLADLIQGLRAISIHGPVDREITGVRYDSRRVGPGNLFVAVRGACFDGHSFIEQARLRFEVLFHPVMKVQMVLRKISKGAHIKRNFARPSLT